MTGLESCQRKTFNVKILFSFFLSYVYTVPVEFLTSWKIAPNTLFTWNQYKFLHCSRNCWTVIFPSKISNSITRKPVLAISVCKINFLSFSWIQLSNQVCMQPRIMPYTNLDGHQVNLLLFKFSTVPVKNLTLILIFKFLFGQYHVNVALNWGSITEWPTHQTYNLQNTCVRSILENQITFRINREFHFGHWSDMKKDNNLTSTHQRNLKYKIVLLFTVTKFKCG